jgi:hypothetical protein
MRSKVLPVIAMGVVLICKADDATVTTYLGSEGSTFEKVKSPSNANKLIEMKTLWEANLDPFVSDMYDNDHNLLLVGDDLYLYVEHYTGSSIKCYLRQFDVNNGDYKGTLNLDYPSTIVSPGGYARLLMTDDAGHVVLVGIMRKNDSDPGDLSTYVYRYDPKEASFVAKNKNGYVMKNNRFATMFEPYDCHGNVEGDDFSFSVGTWRCSLSDKTLSPTLYKFSFEDNSITANEEVNYVDNSIYSFPVRTLDTSLRAGNLISIKDVDESTQLVQLFGSSYTTQDHSPVILYQKDDAGNWIQKDKLVKIGDETIPYTSHCFGAFPVKLGDEELLILPYQFDEKNGTTFKVLHWADISTLSSGLTELWSFPNQNLPFAYKEGTKIYEAERPKVLVSTYKNADGYDEAKVYAYMPGSFLGAYTIALSDEETAASTVTVSQDVADTPYILEGRSLTVNPDNASEQSPLQVALYSIAGQCVLSKTVTDSSAFTEDLTSLTPGLYLLRLNSATTKLALQ